MITKDQKIYATVLVKYDETFYSHNKMELQQTTIMKLSTVKLLRANTVLLVYPFPLSKIIIEILATSLIVKNHLLVHLIVKVWSLREQITWELCSAFSQGK